MSSGAKAAYKIVEVLWGRDTGVIAEAGMGLSPRAAMAILTPSWNESDSMFACSLVSGTTAWGKSVSSLLFRNLLRQSDPLTAWMQRKSGCSRRFQPWSKRFCEENVRAFRLRVGDPRIVTSSLAYVNHKIEESKSCVVLDVWVPQSSGHQNERHWSYTQS